MQRGYLIKLDVKFISLYRLIKTSLINSRSITRLHYYAGAYKEVAIFTKRKPFMINETSGKVFVISKGLLSCLGKGYLPQRILVYIL